MNLLRQSHVSLFDIRLSATDRDVIVLRGAPDEAAPVLLAGKVVLSISEPLTIKRIRLKLVGRLRVSWIEPPTNKQGAPRPVRYENPIFEHEWPSLESRAHSAEASSRDGSVSPAGVRTGVSSGTGTGTSTPATTGAPSQSPSQSQSATSTHTLTTGNHEFPFELVLPSNIPESVEGLEGGQVVYSLVAIAERGRFASNIQTRKHFRIVRTIGPDAFDIAQTVSITNTWPNKVDYTIESPSKAVAIGSSIPVIINMVPQLKGLKLGQVRIQLVRSVHLATANGARHSVEKTVVEHRIDAPADGMIGQDEWRVDGVMHLPASLSKLTQDCTITQHIKVTHKLKFTIALHNPDGHTSELRASLPMYLFISPNIAVSSLDPTIPRGLRLTSNGSGPVSLTSSTGQRTQSNGPVSLLSAPSSSSPAISPVQSPVDEPEDILFASSANNNGIGANDILGISAPPAYEDHVYDRLWQEVPTPNLESPATSEASTPATRSRRNSAEPDGLPSLTPLQRSELTAGLRALEIAQRNGSLHNDQTSALASLSTSPNHADYSHQSYANSPYGSPGAVTPDIQALSRVPSYSTALRSDVDNEFAPDYSSTIDDSIPIPQPVAVNRTNGRSTSRSYSRASSPGASNWNASSSSNRPLSRSLSSRSLFEEATRLMRLTTDKSKP